MKSRSLAIAFGVASIVTGPAMAQIAVIDSPVLQLSSDYVTSGFTLVPGLGCVLTNSGVTAPCDPAIVQKVTTETTDHPGVPVIVDTETKLLLTKIYSVLLQMQATQHSEGASK